jgi:uridine kinase
MKRYSLMNAIQLIEKCQELSGKNRRPLLISVDGRSGSGKTLFCHLLKKLLLHHSFQTSSVTLDLFWTQDNLYSRLCKWNSHEPDARNIEFSYDWVCFKEKILVELHNFERTFKGSNPWVDSIFKHDRNGLRAGGIILIDGCTSQRKELRPFYDINIYISLDYEACITNSIKRESPELGEYYSSTWRKEENEYLLHHAPERSANFTAINLIEAKSFKIEEGPSVLLACEDSL